MAMGKQMQNLGRTSSWKAIPRVVYDAFGDANAKIDGYNLGNGETKIVCEAYNFEYIEDMRFDARRNILKVAEK